MLSQYIRIYTITEHRRCAMRLNVEFYPENAKIDGQTHEPGVTKSQKIVEHVELLWKPTGHSLAKIFLVLRTCERENGR